MRLLGPPICKSRFVHVIKRLYGFHLVWEPALEDHVGSDFMKARRRIHYIEDDLEALGVPRNDLALIARCSASANLLRHRGVALGSCYVMEGSTLGGQVITKAISNSSWAPPGGLRTFNPYGAETAIMWRSFTNWLEENARGADRASVLRGARGTFDLLSSWLPE